MTVITLQAPMPGFKDQSDWLMSLTPDITGSLITAASDVALVLDRHGIIKDVSFSTEELRRENWADWIGTNWEDTVTVETRAKVRDLLSGARNEAPVQFRQVNHASASSIDVPVRYSAMQVGDDGTIIALGRDLRSYVNLQQRLVESQQAMEREYARLRMAETRYRMLFHLASEPVIIVDAGTLRVVEANPAAQRQIDIANDRLTSTSILICLTPDSSEAFQLMLRGVRATGKAEEVEVVLATSGKRFRALASAFRQDNASLLLVRLVPVAGLEQPEDAAAGRVHAVLESFPDGFVVISPDLKILEANRAFLDLTQLTSKQQVLGEPLENWLGRPGIDMSILMSTLNDHHVVRNFTTVIRGAFGSVEEVEISAVPALTGETPSYGFVIRNLAAKTVLAGHRGRSLPRSVEHLTELVGRVSLRELVRETTDVIEKLCIEAALELSKDNRASAAQMLGLSRQSFYSKLRRYGLGELDDDEGSGELNS